MPKNFKNKIKIFFFIVLSGFAVYAFSLHLSKAIEQKAQVIFFSVGQGDAILIQENRMQILVDGGNGRDILNRLGESMPFADKNIDLVVVTHPDEDHLGGLIKVLENYEVEQVLEPGIACDKDMCKKWKEIIRNNHVKDLDAKLGQSIRFGDKIEISVLYPATDLAGQNLKNTNDASVVLKARVNGKTYLLTGDTEDKNEKEMIAGGLDLRADVLKVAHHGSRNSTSAAFLQEVTPDEAVISVGKNSYGHPTEEVLNRLKNMGVEILRTDEKGNISF